ncbi:hypothetical protein HPB50_003209 [Hyalomma asiaticum]|uniref:Uncharacterized protein n=1 Tax=Hyalomma asiaticum TaxID=266040 RepID=A0ACB7TEA3_HYAAI|nr:hypothetical protein HPB50_003209 [Hyalomma asiaticum]
MRVLKNREDKDHEMRMVIFVGSPVAATIDELDQIANHLKNKNVNVDFVNYGEYDQQVSLEEHDHEAEASQENSSGAVLPSEEHEIVDLTGDDPEEETGHLGTVDGWPDHGTTTEGAVLPSEEHEIVDLTGDDPEEETGDLGTVDGWPDHGTMTGENAYTTLKQLLISRLTPSEPQRLQQLLHDTELGDRTTSQLLRHMRQLLHTDGATTTDTDSRLLRELFQRLPGNVRMILASAADKRLSELAELADSVLAVAPPSVAALQPDIAGRAPTTALHDIREQISRLAGGGRLQHSTKRVNTAACRENGAQGRDPRKTAGSCFCGDRQRSAQQVEQLVHPSSVPKPPEVHSRRRRASDLKNLRLATGAHQRPNHRANVEPPAPTGYPLPKLGATGSAARKLTRSCA